MVLLITEIGNSVGSACEFSSALLDISIGTMITMTDCYCSLSVATLVYQNDMPTQLAKFIPTNDAKLLNDLYESITEISHVSSS